jgi:hypothetical protein
VRIALTYDQCSDGYTSTPDTLLADLDLIVVEDLLEAGGPDFLVHTRNSHVDNYEVLQFTATGRANVQLRVRAQHWEPCTDESRRTHLSISWDIPSR